MSKGLHLITAGLGSRSWERAASRLAHQARSTGWFTTITNYDVELLDRQLPEFRRDNSRLLTEGTRGFGYWLWRPYVIRKALMENDDNETVLFLDAGCELNKTASSEIRLDFYIAHAQRYGICIMRTSHLLTEWCKRDTLDVFQISVNSEIRTLEPGAMFLKKSDSNQQLMTEWINYGRCKDFHLLDDSPSDLPNSNRFREHRHDQAILTCLLRSRSDVSLEQETYFAKEGWNKAGKPYPIWVTRNRSRILHFTGPVVFRVAYHIYRSLRSRAGRIRRHLGSQPGFIQ